MQDGADGAPAAVVENVSDGEPEQTTPQPPPAPPNPRARRSLAHMSDEELMAAIQAQAARALALHQQASAMRQEGQDYAEQIHEETGTRVVLPPAIEDPIPPPPAIAQQCVDAAAAELGIGENDMDEHDDDR